MNKHIRFLAISAMLLCIATANAEPVGLDRARTVALNFLRNTEPGIDQLTIQSLHDITSTTPFREFYVFSINNGFILVSGDDCALPILGYSTSNTFVGKDIPEHVKSWLDSYEEQIYEMKRNNTSAGPEVRNAWMQLSAENNVPRFNNNNASAVAPLITTTWSQSPLYNNMCPYDSRYGSRTVTGCVATAMAQIMRYWSWPVSGSGAYTYTHSTYGTLSANFNTTYDWNNMPTALDTASTSAEIAATALLNYHCGVAVQMDYSTTGSGAHITGGAYYHSASYALKSYFKYKAIEAFETNYNYARWVALLKNELDNNRPILYGGRGSYGGHAFVCDGYDTNSLFHFNWGWGGSYNGYFTIGSLNPGRYTFNSSVEILIGIEPSNCTYLPSYNYTLTPNDRWSTNLSTPDSGCWDIYKFSLVPGYTYTFKTCCDDGAWDNTSASLSMYDSLGYSLPNEYYNEYDEYYYYDNSLVEYNPTDTCYIFLKVEPYYSTGSYSLAYKRGIYYNIHANSDPCYGGIPEGVGRYDKDSICTLVASSFEDFDFVGWYCGDTLVSTSSSYSFIVTGDRSLTARFAYSVNNCTIGEGDLPDTTDFDDVPLHFESEGDYCYRTTPFCWYIFEQDSYWQSYIYVDQFWDNDGDYNQVLYFSSSDTTGSTPSRFCMLPPIDSTAYPLSTLQLSFMMYNNSYSGNPYVEVGVLTDPDDTNSFIPIQTVYATNSDEFVNNTVLFQDYSGPHGRITIKFPNPPTGYSSLYIDDVILEVIPTCPAVQNPLFNNITAYSADLSWTEVADGTSWTVQYMPTESSSAYMQTLHTTNPFITLTDLIPNTEYAVSITVDCIDDNGGTIRTGFRSACALISSLPYTNNFEANPNNSSGSSLPYCFSRFGSLSYPHVTYHSNNSSHGGSCMYFYSPSNDPCQALVLPELDPSIDISRLQLNFWVKTYENNPHSFQIGVMTDPDDSTTFVGVDTMVISNAQWSLLEVPLSSYTGHGRYIAIKVDSINSSSYWYAYLDDITLDYIPSCIAPHNVFATNTSPTSITIDWVDSTAAPEWQIEYGPRGYRQGSYQRKLLTVTTHPVTITGLDTAKGYDFYVRPICTAGDTAWWVAPTTFYTTICDYPAYCAIGSEKSTGKTSEAPVGSTYNYSLTETIIDSAELGGPLDIEYIAYFLDYNSGSTYHTNCVIYMQPTSKTSFISTSNVEALDTSRAVRVYSRTFHVTPGWNYFRLDSVYHYDGHSNLMVIFDYNSHTGLFSSSTPNFKSEPCAANKLLVYNDHTYDPEVTRPFSYQGYKRIYSYRPVMRFVGCSNEPDPCQTPISLPYSDNFDTYTTSTTAKTGVEPSCWTLVHQDVAMTDEYKPMIYYNPANTHSGNYSLIINKRGIYAMPPVDTNVNSLQLSFYLKQQYTKYRLEVGVMTNPADASTFTPVTTLDNGTTGVEYVTVDFANYTGNGRYIAFHNILAPGYSGDFSCNYIDDLTLAVRPQQCGIAFRDLPYTDNFDTYTATTTPKTGIEPPCWTLAHQYVTITDEYRPMVYYNPDYAHSGNYSLIINKRCIYAMPPVEIDVNRLKLTFYLCQPQAKYRLQVGVMTDLNDASTFTPVATLNNSSTTSILRTVSFASYTGKGRYIAFRNTLASGNKGDYSCNYIDDLTLALNTSVCNIDESDLPYTDNFDSYTSSTTPKTDVEPTCWTLVHRDVPFTDEYRPMIYYSPSYARSGNYSLIINKRAIYIMPYFNGDVSTLQLRFYLRQPKAKYRLQVGVMTDPADPATFTAVKTFNNTSTTSSVLRTVDFYSYTGTGRYIAFRNTLDPEYTGDFSCNYIDDLTLSLSPATTPKDNQSDNSFSMDEPRRLTLFPNPTTGRLTVETDEEVIRVDVFDYTGRCVATFQGQTTLDLSRLASGLYTLRVTLPDHIEVRRVVKQ